MLLPSFARPQVQAILISRLAGEMRLYETAMKQFKQQMKAVPHLKRFADQLPLDPAFDPKNANFYQHFLPPDE